MCLSWQKITVANEALKFQNKTTRMGNASILFTFTKKAISHYCYL